MENTRSKILNLYAIFSVSLILSFLPHAALSALGLVFSIVVLIACYHTRRKHAGDNFALSHLNLLIRSFWNGSLIMLATTIPACLVMMKMIDNKPLDACFNNLSPDLLAAESAEQFNSLQTTIQPCMDAYIQANMTIFILSGLIAFVPGIIYIAVKYTRGFQLAQKNLPASDKPDKKVAL